MFNRPGLLGGLAAGFLGAGLLGLLMGHGFLGGLGSLASFFGLLLQVGLVVIVARLLWNMFARRNEPATANGPSMRHIYGNEPNKGVVDLGEKTGSDFFVPAKLDLTAKDFDEFEDLLGRVQKAYSDEDLAALRTQVTPEMLSYFAEEFAHNASRGVQNKVTNVKLEQGDLAEAWREDGGEYATVAMRFSLVDQMVDRKSGAVVEGSDTPQDTTEAWTFRRAPRGRWMLSAIQQA
jgi:predicted lipid-binding transport protein (Tim44 family)